MSTAFTLSDGSIEANQTTPAEVNPLSSINFDLHASNSSDFSRHIINAPLKLQGKDLKNETDCFFSELKNDTLDFHNEAFDTAMTKVVSLDNYNHQNFGFVQNSAPPRNTTFLTMQLQNNTNDLFDIDFNETFQTDIEKSQKSNSSSNTTSQNKKVQVWENGILKRKLLNKILTYLRAGMIIPVSMSVISVMLSVAVFKSKNFVYKGKPLVISFNLFEGLKSVAYLVFRMVKLYYGDSQITWNSWYARIFMYQVMWLPVSLGRIGFLLNGLITLDRFFTLAFPLRRFNNELVTYPKICIVVIVVSMFAYQAGPLIIFFKDVQPRLDYQKPFHNDEINSEIYVANPKAWGIYLRLLVIGDFLFVYIPLLLALILNILTLISLWRHSKTVQSTLKNNTSDTAPQVLSKSQVVKRQINKMIVGSSVIFVLLVLFRRVLWLIPFFAKDFGDGRREMHLYILMREIFHIFDCMSPLANIISYISLSSQFRRRLKGVMFPRSNSDSTDDGSNLSA